MRYLEVRNQSILALKKTGCKTAIPLDPQYRSMAATCTFLFKVNCYYKIMWDFEMFS